jgi:integrase
MAGLGPEVTPHGLKHSCATLMLQNRISTSDVAGVLGTSQAVIRKTYGLHSVEHVRSAVDVWSKRPVKPGHSGFPGRYKSPNELSD